MSAVLYVGVYLNTRLSQDHIIWFQSNPKEGRYRVFHTPYISSDYQCTCIYQVVHELLIMLCIHFC